MRSQSPTAQIEGYGTAVNEDVAINVRVYELLNHQFLPSRVNPRLGW